MSNLIEQLEALKIYESAIHDKTINDAIKKILQLQAEKKALTDDIFKMNDKCVAIRRKLQAELDKLKEFARKVITTECWSLDSQDGGDLQELAEKLGLIVKYTATKDDIDDEFGSDFEIGDTIFKFSDMLKEPKK